ncbi:Methanethiol S-methyltransferase 1 [Gammaproteobacteria bacterium]
MKRIVIFIYGIMGFLLFNVSIVYFINFVAKLNSPFNKIDVGENNGMFVTFFFNSTLMILFGLHHSFMARPRFKQWLVNLLPESIERTTYIVLASLLLLILSWNWQPLPIIIWRVIPFPYFPYLLLVALFWLGWILALFSSSLIDIFDLTGLRQVYSYWRNAPYIPPKFKVVSLYRYIRHPVMLGILIGLWSTPTMTMGHLLLSMGFTIYIFIGIIYEERDLAKIFGDEYREYQKKTRIIIPFIF